MFSFLQTSEQKKTKMEIDPDCLDVILGFFFIDLERNNKIRYSPEKRRWVGKNKKNRHPSLLYRTLNHRIDELIMKKIVIDVCETYELIRKSLSFEEFLWKI
jgi:hypothetical protein